ncbi:MAG: NAD(P)-dependent oxidoreductase [Muribaculaceae bacterium]|nr:NAD(P)-dependent oxidoreductase [Muribaculaceae bacterium]
MKTLLIVGGGGFIGGFIARQGAELGYEVWVTVRASTSLRYLVDERLHIITVDYDDEEAMKNIFSQRKPSASGWDYVVYNLGATKAMDFPEFNHVNFQYLRNVVTALKHAECNPRLLLFMSSLSATIGGTRYGLSKLKAEQWLELQSGMPWVIFRPTGVYGPHEKDYLMMIKSIDRHVDFGVGFRRQFLTFIYVEDLVDAIYKALDHRDNVVYKKYVISEKLSYTQKQFRKIVKQALGRKWVIPIKLPLWLTYIVSYISEKWNKWHHRTSTLNRDKFKIMKHRDWRNDVSAAERDFGFDPRHSLEEGIKLTVEYYKNNKK